MAGKPKPSPHITTPRTTTSIMLDVCIALIFPAIAATYFFGWQVPVMIILGIASAVGAEALWQYLRKKPMTVWDGSAVVTGFLVGLSLPVSAPWWATVLGSVFAIIVVKQWLGGGLGRNMFNPAVAARVMLKAFFTPWITNWILPGPDAVATATPLSFIGNGASSVPADVPGLQDLFLGLNLGGNIGETSALAITIGMIYLIARGVIDAKTPILFILSTTLTVGLLSEFNFLFMMTHALSGTLFFGAVYMATDYSSGCLTPQGKTIFAIGCGVLTALFRMLFNFPGGVGFAILIMNALAPLIDRRFAPKIYGRRKRPQLAFNRQRSRG